MSNLKIAQERQILTLAKPLLKKLYGDFVVDLSQTDRPDAAIKVLQPRKQVDRTGASFSIGVEITTVDQQEPLAYFNGARSELQAVDITISKSYIYDGAIKKTDKYKEYAEVKAFREIILICFSQVLGVHDPFFTQCVVGWTGFLLHKASFPFEKVIFVDLKANEARVVYDVRKPVLTPPSVACETQVVRGVTDFEALLDNSISIG